MVQGDSSTPVKQNGGVQLRRLVVDGGIGHGFQRVVRYWRNDVADPATRRPCDFVATTEGIGVCELAPETDNVVGFVVAEDGHIHDTTGGSITPIELRCEVSEILARAGSVATAADGCS